MSSENGSEDLFSALESLSRSIAPHLKTVVFVALVLNQTPIFPDVKSLVLSQLSNPLVLIIALYFGGIWSLPNGQPKDETTWTAAFLGPFYALKTVANNVGTYLKVGSLLALAYHLSVYYDFSLPFEPWAQILFVTVTTVVSIFAYLFAPISKVYGPLRFCYLEHAETYWLVLNWWSFTAVLPFFSLQLLPVVIFTLIGVSIGTWVHIYTSYREQVRTITWNVAENAARAKAAADEARDYGAAARKYEEQMTHIAAEARRDAIKANSIRISDFYDCAARVWAAVGQATAPAEDAIIKARRVIDAAVACEDATKPDDKKKEENERLATFLRQSAENAHDRAREMVALIRSAQASVRDSESAAKEDAAGRHKADVTAETACSTAKSLSDTVAGVQDAERKASWAGGAAARRAEEAVTMATNGEIEEAKKAVAASEAAYQVAEESAKVVREGMEVAQRVVQEWLGRV
ncbi:uncharacterized protein FIESC28_00780 [Fusarium coffeatum]|uniref:Uncharacterized protein n=1 Tax=Fusarium coffeatum TaxID=231269 RepID=A0A366SCI8_9HYPO|nr:uncharacterized protein FIESC28_00780 [Fusarium coffeatum]RBR26375.1 hypothetical protein FIESC28_00780 [Fusarium coffeatum]